MKKIFLFLMLFLLMSCVNTRQGGFYFGDNFSKVKNFDVYNFTKDDLINNFGYPSVELNDGSWLYYSYSTKNLKISRPKLDKEQILLVKFNQNDEIVNYYFKENNNKKIIDNTDLQSNRKQGFFRSLFSGLIINPIN